MDMSSAEEETIFSEESIQLRTIIRRPNPPNHLPVKNRAPLDPYEHPPKRRSPSPADPPLPPPPHVEGNEETDEELLEVLHPHEQNGIHIPRPKKKTQILHYFSQASSFKLKRVGQDLQITDQDEFPLFDVWTDINCCKCTWVIEAYGRVVLLLHEERRGDGACNGSRRAIMVTDWNGDIFGYLIPGDPFLLQSPDKQTVAKLIPHHNPQRVESGLSSQITTATGNASGSVRSVADKHAPARHSAYCRQNTNAANAVF